MPFLTDPGEIRRRLTNDPAWNAYALGDLDARRFPYSRWYGFPNDPAIALLYCEFPEPIFFFHGAPQSLYRLLPEIPLDKPLHIQLQPPALDVLSARVSFAWTKPMIRMRLHAPALEAAGAQPLNASHSQALELLYADGTQHNQSPDLFFPSMLDDGCFYGVEREGRLAAAAGTHLVSREERVAAIGNVYTHRQWRGQGLAKCATSAVIQALLAAGIETIVLSVAETNTAAIRVYHQLGFVRHCHFFEGMTIEAR